MKPGRELDALVAEKVMGCTLERRKIGTVAGWEIDPHCRCPGQPHEFSDRDYETVELKRYSTDIAAAWEVVEKISVKNGTVLVIPERNIVAIDDDLAFAYDQGWLWHVEGESIPHAICLAALRAVGA